MGAPECHHECAALALGIVDVVEQMKQLVTIVEKQDERIEKLEAKVGQSNDDTLIDLTD